MKECAEYTTKLYGGWGVFDLEMKGGGGVFFKTRYRLSGLVCIGSYLLLPAPLGYRGMVGIRVYPNS